MKKFLTVFLSLLLCVGVAAGVSACADKTAIKVFAPDGAPALALARSIGEDENFKINVVEASTVNAYVTGEQPEADVCLLPVNAAVKLLGSGEKYKMLGTVTHGNLFLLKHEGGEDVSSARDLPSLLGKTVGVINLANVPGLTFKAILNANSVAYNELRDGVSVADDKVNLKDVKATAVLPTTEDCDYFVVPEPAASTKIAATKGKLALAGSLQTLYGGTSGYPQAVAVARTELLNTRAAEISDFISKIERNVEWLKDANTSAQTILDKISSAYYKADTQPAFNANNLTVEVINNCGIRYVKSDDCKQEVCDFISKFNAVSSNAWGTPADAFFYSDK